MRSDANTRERFWSRVDFDLASPCWLWTGACNADGYPKVKWHGKDMRAHRLAFEWAYGQIPDGLTVDHLCGIRRCLNWEHLEAVTTSENVKRGKARFKKPRCKRGHPFDYVNVNGHRVCRTCRQMHEKNRTERKRNGKSE